MEKFKKAYTRTYQVLSSFVFYGLVVFLVASLVSFGISLATTGQGTIFGKKPIVILTDSMYPAMSRHMLVIGEPVDPSDLQAGDIISFRFIDEIDEKYGPTAREVMITHRIIDIDYENKKILTKGDNNRSDDAQKLSHNFPDQRLPFANVDYKIIAVWAWTRPVVKLFMSGGLSIAVTLVSILAFYFFLKFLHNRFFDEAYLMSWRNKKHQDALSDDLQLECIREGSPEDPEAPRLESD
ncbi:MAG: signal peptidase I [Clostridiaceae bacterium]|nr:signal peptidase I [Clostridiaceae bacterium]